MKRISIQKVGLIALGGVLALALQGGPAAGHVAGWPHNWKEHIKPRTDKRYYTKGTADQRFQSTVLRPGQLETGVYLAAGASDGGLFGSAISFIPRLPDPLPQENAHYVGEGDAPTSECPGPGEAAAGHLCFYEAWNYSASLLQVYATNDGDSDAPITVHGAGLLFNASNSSANVRGVWAVRAPLTVLPLPAPRPTTGRRTPSGFASH